MSIPKVSVILPARNAESTIASSIQSVLEQDFRDIELLVVVNGCTDDTAVVASSINDKRLKILSSEPGIVNALNTGIYESRGNYIARQDADDTWLPGKLSRQVSMLENENVDVVGTQMNVISSGGINVTNYPLQNLSIKSSILIGNNPIGHPSVVYKKSVVKRVGGYWDLFPLAEDLDMWARLIPFATFANIDIPLVNYSHVPNPKYNPSVPKILGLHYTQLYRTAK
jgi:glycosyltransferase involved in cell wall biosynthesis